MHALFLLNHLILVSDQTRNVVLRSVEVHFDLLNSKESFVNALSDHPRIFAMRCAEAHFNLLINSDSSVRFPSNEDEFCAALRWD